MSATSYYNVKYTDAAGKPRVSRMQSVAGLHTVEQLRDFVELHKTFGKKAVIGDIEKIEDPAAIVDARAERVLATGDQPGVRAAVEAADKK